MSVRTGVADKPRRKPRVRDDSDAELVPDGRLKLPHERDETPNARRTANAVTRQAHRDATGAQQDTDLRRAAVDTFRRGTGTPEKAGTRTPGTRPAKK